MNIQTESLDSEPLESCYRFPWISSLLKLPANGNVFEKFTHPSSCAEYLGLLKKKWGIFLLKPHFSNVQGLELHKIHQNIEFPDYWTDYVEKAVQWYSVFCFFLMFHARGTNSWSGCVSVQIFLSFRINFKKQQKTILLWVPRSITGSRIILFFFFFTVTELKHAGVWL